MSYKVRVTFSRHNPSARGSEPRILLALDKFKGTLTSSEAAAALRRGIERQAGARIETAAIADGGDGTVDAVIGAGYQRVPFVVPGPLGSDVATDVAVRDDQAVAEVASVCGLARLPGGRLHPTRATSYGAGHLLLALHDHGVRTVVLGLGGSASTDGGVGMLQALGVGFRDRDGASIGSGGGELARLAEVDWTGVDPRLSELTVLAASDVDSPLLGFAGAAHTYGPQKGADEPTVAELEAGLGTLVEVLGRFPSPYVRGTSPEQASRAAGAGAAGGLGFGLGLLGARTVSGADVILDLIGLRQLVGDADVVVTGEGRLDEQSLRGKAPIAIARIAAQAGVPVVAAVGACTLTGQEERAAGLTAVWAMEEQDDATAQRPGRSRAALERIGRRIADALHGPPRQDWDDRQQRLNDAVCNGDSRGELANTQEIQCH